MNNPLGATVRWLGTQARQGLLLVVCGFAVLVSFSGTVQARAAAARPTADAQRKMHKAAPAAPVETTPVVELAPAPPPPPLTPGEMPPNAPNVTYVDGLLSISAENSTLADILMAVKASTGTAMDMPAGAGADRVWVTLGPGPARAILAALLSGTNLDYVIQSSDTDPTQIQSVLLTPRMKGGKAGEASGGSQNFASRYRQFMTRPNLGGTDSPDTDSGIVPDAPGGSADADPGVPGAAASSAPANSTADAQPAAADLPASTSNPPLSAHLPVTITEADAHPAPIANPEQAIPQMQNLFELRRQLQQQQNAQAKATGGPR